MSRQLLADSRRCGHCYNEIPQIGSKEKNFCDAKCNNSHYTFRNKILPYVDDQELQSVLKQQLQNNVPTIILTNLVYNWKKESDRLKTKKRYSNQIACFYKSMMMNLESLIEAKSVHMVKQEIVV